MNVTHTKVYAGMVIIVNLPVYMEVEGMLHEQGGTTEFSS